MGSYFSNLFSSLYGNQEFRILILGLDNAGKTTILYRLQVGEVVSTIPTIGFNVEKLTYGNIKIQAWDCGGNTTLRPYWRSYYGSSCAAIIYVIDSADRERLGISKQELFAMLDEPELKDSILMIFANKQDVEGALTEQEISKELGLSKIRDRTWTLFKTSAIKGQGLKEGMEWLVSKLKEQ